jgi:hypothetical protein
MSALLAEPAGLNRGPCGGLGAQPDRSRSAGELTAAAAPHQATSSAQNGSGKRWRLEWPWPWSSRGGE